MSQLGERLRQARENQGLSLAQAASETRIRQQSLQALEEGLYDMLPNDVVAKGFIRNYAQLLELSPDEMIDLYRMETGRSQPIQVVATSSLPRSRSYVLPSFFGVFFVTILLVGLAYFALNTAGYVRDSNAGIATIAGTPTLQAATPTPLSTPSPDEPALAANPESTSEEEADEPETDATAEPAAEEPVSTITPVVIPTLDIAGAAATSTPEPTTTPTPAAPIVVEVDVVSESGEGSWLRVTTDGNIVYEQIMASGEQQTFLAQRQINIRAGNPSDVMVSVNGLPPERLGQVPGEPVDWSWPPQ